MCCQTQGKSEGKAFHGYLLHRLWIDSLYPGIYGDELYCGIAAVFFQEQIGGLYGREAGLAEAGLASVVEDDVGGPVLLLVSGDPADGAVCDIFRGVGLPVFRENVPLDRCEVQLASDVEDGGTASSVRWAEEAEGVPMVSSRRALQPAISSRMRAVDCQASQGWVIVWLPMRCPDAAMARTICGR